MKVARSLTARTATSRRRLYVVAGRDAYEFGDVELEVWKLCDGSRSVADISAAIVEQFAVPAETAATDVEEFVAEMLAAGLVESVHE